MKLPLINGLNHTNGCEKAPDKILDVLNKEIWANEQSVEISDKKLEVKGLSLDNFNLEESNSKIHKSVFECFRNSGNERVFLMGGDHAVSYASCKAFMDFNNSLGKNSCLIVLDAHPDLMEPVDLTIPTHEEWLRALIESGFPAENVLLVGLRNSDISELDFIKQNRIKTISINQFVEDIEGTCEIIMEFASRKELYLSVDIDIVDPAFAPATGYCEPGGLSSRQLIYLIQRMNKMKNLKAIDLIEINPEKDKNHNNMTVKLGAKILSELM